MWRLSRADVLRRPSLPDFLVFTARKRPSRGHDGQTQRMPDTSQGGLAPSLKSVCPWGGTGALGRHNLAHFCGICGRTLMSTLRHWTCFAVAVANAEILMKALIDHFGYVPETCVWELTRACNLRCGHCGTSAGRRRACELSTAEAVDL